MAKFEHEDGIEGAVRAATNDMRASREELGKGNKARVRVSGALEAPAVRAARSAVELHEAAWTAVPEESKALHIVFKAGHEGIVDD